MHKHLGTERFPRLFRLIGELGKPTICAANGHVLAGALGLALACDLIVAREGVRFGTPEINVGAFPFMIMALIYRNVGAQEDERAAAARRADLRRGGRADRDRQQGRRRPTEFDARRGRVGGAARRQVAGDHAAGQGRDVPPAGHGVRGRARLPARAAHARVLDRGHPRGREGVLREAGAGRGPAGDPCLRGRTSDRTAGGRGAGRRGAGPRARRRAVVGEPGEPRDARLERGPADRAAGARGAAAALARRVRRRRAARC